jgi:hypothetical protein
VIDAPTKLGGQRTFPAKRSPTMKLQSELMCL